MPFRPDIEGLRGVAVLLVLFFHFAAPGFSKGFIGLDIFFVLSGFLITGVIQREIPENRFSITRFWSRRVKRLFPALFATVCLSSLCAWFILGPSDFAVFQKSVIASIFSYANIFFYYTVNFETSPPIMHPLLNVWSLSVEEQFYFVWPLMLAAALTRLTHKTCLMLTAALIVASLVISELLVRGGGTGAFYLLPGRAWELLIGAFLALSRAQIRWTGLSNGVAIVGAALLGAALVGVDAGTAFPGLSALIPCAGAALIVLAGSSGGGIIGSFLSIVPLRFAGRISYSLYLIHWPVISITMFYTKEPLSAELGIALCALSFGLAALMWRFVETPFRETSLRPRMVFAAALSAAVPVALAAAIFIYSQPIPA
ncbi:MAG: acyltransferase [Hyphomicrobiales bacterium]|nr:acyltransferase [Hyphomicrobiales bacterium]